MELINKELNGMLNDLVGKCFAINRMLDRGISILSIKFKMINASKIIHQKIAHIYPSDIFADSISGYQSERNMLTIYPETPIGNRDYNTPLDFIKDYYKENIELQDMIYDCVEKAIEVGDHTTKVFLDGLLNRLSKYTALSINLIDLFESYGNDTFRIELLDSVIDKYL